MLNLTHMDVKKLTQEPSARVRSMLAAKIVMDFRSGNFTENESEIAVDIFRILLKDTEKKVRKTLSEHLSHCPHAPHDVVVKLASDETDVAVHVLEHSTVLTDDDLIQIAKATKEVLKLCAIARRNEVSENVSDILLDSSQEQVLNSLFHNRGARVAEKSYLKHWNYIAAKPGLLETLVHRGNLPIHVAEKVYFVVTDEMKRHLNKTYKIGVPLAQKASSDTREWEMLGIIPAEGSIVPGDDEQVEGLIDQLFLGGRLTHSFLMRALCVGSLGVFEAGLARLAGVPRVNARILLMDGGALGFHAIYKAAGMPEGFTTAVRTLLQISLEESDFGRSKSADFRRQVIDKIYQNGFNRSVDNMEYLLAIIGGKLAPASIH